ncbi:efflux RND transporter periplasmic adaptor subunit [Rhodoferax sp.]|uniref:efflux RND transporter periplasmic adaptor subunit n=1 Tax=Rhodoferax sp. TaxID=50421 RepID=UPI0025FCABF0|nr:efflux RND transporter periplasmic adaptor subunit [Rhodoferax sp.]
MALLIGGALRTLSARQTKQAALQAQQDAQKTQVAIKLAATDLLQVKLRRLPATLPISGTVKAVNTAFVKARIPGEIQGLTVREGDTVKAGQVLARVDPLESRARLDQARQQVQTARAQVDIAQRSFDNNRALVAQGFISGTALENSQANLAAAQATLAATQAGAELATKALDDTVMRAPVAGQVSQRLVQNGERVAVETRVLEIVDLSRLELEASVSSADAMQLKIGQLAQVRVDGSSQPVSATLARINPSASAGSRAVQLYLAIAPGSGLRHGLFAQGLLHTGSQSLLSVPLSAVRTDKPAPYLQISLQNKVQYSPVVIGQKSEIDGETMVAVEGVSEGTLVLAGHVGALRANTPVQLGASAPAKP